MQGFHLQLPTRCVDDRPTDDDFTTSSEAHLQTIASYPTPVTDEADRESIDYDRDETISIGMGANEDPTNPHRIAEARSLALHREVARVLRERPAVLETVRARVERWRQEGSGAHPYAEAWSRVLSRDLDSIEAFITDPGQTARDLRQSSPFAGILDPRARWRVLREVHGG